VRESTHETDERKAQKFLAKRQGSVALGTFLGPQLEKIKVGELADDLLKAYEAEVIPGGKSLEWAKRRWNLHLKDHFAHLRAVSVGTVELNKYVALRQEERAEPATINREISFLRRAFRFALQAQPAKVTRVPVFPHLTENNVRQGFLEDAQLDKLADECVKVGWWLRAMLAVGASYGWRKGEVLGLRVRQVDLSSRTIRLEHGTTKNGQGRLVKMTNNVALLMQACIAGKGPDDHVFTRANGDPVRNFRKSWHNAVTAAGVPGLLFHDLRRTGARNLRRLGVSEHVVQAIGGWKTPSMFRRYDIISESDLQDAADRLNAKAASRSEEKNSGERPANFLEFRQKTDKMPVSEHHAQCSAEIQRPN